MPSGARPKFTVRSAGCLPRIYFLFFHRNVKCNQPNFNMTRSFRGWSFYPTRMLPDFSINIAGDNQSLILFDAATCASETAIADVIFHLILFPHVCVIFCQVSSTGLSQILVPVVVNLIIVALAVVLMCALCIRVPSQTLFPTFYSFSDMCSRPIISASSPTL